MAGWLAVVATLAGGLGLLTIPALPRRRPRDAFRAVIYTVAAVPSGVAAAASAVWIVPTVIAAAGAGLHLSRLRRPTTHKTQKEISDGS